MVVVFVELVYDSMIILIIYIGFIMIIVRIFINFPLPTLLLVHLELIFVMDFNCNNQFIQKFLVLFIVVVIISND